MDDRQAGADARIGRRRFLQMGTGVAGSAAVAAMLAACGAPASAPTAEQDKTALMSAMTLGSYLVIARYNRDKWKRLSADDRKQAEAAAEVLFPEQADSLGAAKGMPFVRTLHTGIHAKIPYDFRALPQGQRDQMVETIFDDFKTRPAKIDGTDETDPGVGWIAVVDSDRFASFVQQSGGKQGPLWRMYDIEVIPLNNDRTTSDVYELMTPVHWGSPQRQS